MAQIKYSIRLAAQTLLLDPEPSDAKPPALPRTTCWRYVLHMLTWTQDGSGWIGTGHPGSSFIKDPGAASSKGCAENLEKLGVWEAVLTKSLGCITSCRALRWCWHWSLERTLDHFVIAGSQVRMRSDPGGGFPCTPLLSSRESLAEQN